MNVLTFNVQGSDPNPYTVEVQRTRNGHLTVTCTCKAGQYGRLCKHRVRLLSGEDTGVASRSERRNIAKVRDWLHNSNLEEPLLDVFQAQEALQEAEDHLRKVRRRLNRLMTDG